MGACGQAQLWRQSTEVYALCRVQVSVAQVVSFVSSNPNFVAGLTAHVNMPGAVRVAWRSVADFARDNKVR